MKAGRGLFLIVLILGAAGPLYLLLKVSVSPPAEVMTPHPLLLPHAVTWRFWERVLASGQIAAPLWKSLGVASGVALLALAFAGPAAYSLALPGLAVCGLLVWLLSWEEFTLATYLILGTKTMPLQVYYYLYQGNWFDTAVAATLMTVPVLVLSVFLQRYLRETSLAGVMR